MSGLGGYGFKGVEGLLGFGFGDFWASDLGTFGLRLSDGADCPCSLHLGF